VGVITPRFNSADCELTRGEAECDRTSGCVWVASQAGCGTDDRPGSGRRLFFDNSTGEVANAPAGTAGRRCLSWDPSDAGRAGAALHARRCDGSGPSSSAGSKFAIVRHEAMAHLHGRREDSGVQLRASGGGLCVGPAPYTKGDPRYAPPHPPAVFPCPAADGVDPGLRLTPWPASR
jgi:hypothetical protein